MNTHVTPTVFIPKVYLLTLLFLFSFYDKYFYLFREMYISNTSVVYYKDTQETRLSLVPKLQTHYRVSIFRYLETVFMDLVFQNTINII